MVAPAGQSPSRSTPWILRVLVRLAIMLIAAYGVSLGLGIFEGKFDISVLNFFTLLSNLYVVLYYIGDLVFLLSGRDPSRSTWLPRWKGSVILAIMLTTLVYHFMLSPAYVDLPGYNFLAPSNLIPHYIVGPLVLLDWLLLDRKGFFRARDPLLWTAVPYAYLAYSLVRSTYIGPIYNNNQSRFPYPFLDYDKLGIPNVITTIIVISVLYIAFGYLLYGLDRLTVRIGARRHAGS